MTKRRRTPEREEALPSGHYRLLGKFVVAFADLEHEMEKDIGYILSLEPKELKLITSKMEAGSKLTVLRALINMRIGIERRQECKDLFEDIDMAITNRNFLIHGIWTMERGIPSAVSLRPKAPDDMISGLDFSSKTLFQYIEFVSKCRKDLSFIVDLLPPS